MRQELAANWRILLGCILGIAVGVVALPTAALAIFMPALEGEFGWSRAAISLAGSILVAALFVTAPVVGWIADRTSEARMILASLFALGIAFLLFSRMPGDIRLFLAGFGLMALLASGASTIPFARIISAHFVAARGFALGLAMTGTGLSGILLPLFLVPYVAGSGWRAGFLVLAIIVLSAMPFVWLLLRATRPRSAASVREPAFEAPGRPFSEAIRSREFVVLALAFALVSLAAAGIAVHFVALLGDAGFSPARAGALTSLTGLSVIIARVATGWLIDRIFAPWVAAAMMAVAALSLLSLAAAGTSAAPLGAIAYGLAVGSEIDILAYLTARYFGMRAYGRVYGALYMALLAGAALSPLGYGLGVDLAGSYAAPLTVAGGLLALSAALFLMLPAFQPHPPTDAGLRTPQETRHAKPRPGAD